MISGKDNERPESLFVQPYKQGCACVACKAQKTYGQIKREFEASGRIIDIISKIGEGTGGIPLRGKLAIRISEEIAEELTRLGFREIEREGDGVPFIREDTISEVMSSKGYMFMEVSK